MTSLCPCKMNKCVCNTENLPPAAVKEQRAGQETDRDMQKQSQHLSAGVFGRFIEFFPVSAVERRVAGESASHAGVCD